MLSKDLLAVLCCPKCRGDLSYQADGEALTCRSCKRVYPIRDGIPILVVNDDQ